MESPGIVEDSFSLVNALRDTTNLRTPTVSLRITYTCHHVDSALVSAACRALKWAPVVLAHLSALALLLALPSALALLLALPSALALLLALPSALALPSVAVWASAPLSAVVESVFATVPALSLALAVWSVPASYSARVFCLASVFWSVPASYSALASYSARAFCSAQARGSAWGHMAAWWATELRSAEQELLASAMLAYAVVARLRWVPLGRYESAVASVVQDRLAATAVPHRA